MPVRGLTLVVAGASPDRFRCALTMALAQAALGGRARILVDGDAVALLRKPIAGPGDQRHADAGLPTLDMLVSEALDAGVRVTLCQTGLALTGAEPAEFDARVDYGGMVSLMAELDDDRLVAV